MDMNVNTTSAPKGIEINIIYLLESVLKKWWVLLLSAVVAGAMGLGCAFITSTPTYSTNLSFVIYNKNANDVNDSSDITSSIKVAQTFEYILEGRTMCEKIAKSCRSDITAEEISEAMSASVMTDTNIIIVDIKNESADITYEIACGLASNYGEIVNYAYPNATLQMYEEPFMPTETDSQTSLMVFTLIGAVLGLAIAVISIVISNATHDTVRASDDIQLKLDANLLGTVDSVKTGKGKNKIKRLLITDRTLGFSFIESYKAIRTKVETYCSRNDCKVIMVTSANENEGKTTFAMNLALSLAQNGKSVLVIDADMRKPAVCKFLNLTVSPECDLANVISGKTELSDAIKYVEKHKLFILATVQANDEPTEILSSQQMNKLIKAARSEFDFVIVDTAPASVVADANILSNFADAAILVVREDFAACARIRGVIDDISQNKAELIGCVYNYASTSGVRGAYGKYKYGYGYGGYGYGGYGYGYGYGYGHSSSDKAKEENEN
ncbi:MAG: polysaccharide biosynthesis tyrosine autokinase [Clostridia bacterium]|nr:polysaccharide biosynthesis tyrosine autokinase [Clostridia bacterium]